MWFQVAWIGSASDAFDTEQQPDLRKKSRYIFPLRFYSTYSGSDEHLKPVKGLAPGPEIPRCITFI